ncbi:cellulose biosynthesis protein BcsC [Frateuria aurantia]
MSQGHMHLATAVLLALAGPVAAQSASSGLQQLLQQGQYWHTHGRDDLAQDAWARALRVDPAQPDALAGLGEVAINKGDRQAAEEWLQRLRQTQASAPQTQRLWAEVAAIGSDLGEARSAARKGDSVAAVAAYRRSFGASQPPQALAAEYYQALAGTPGTGWAMAVDGLRRAEQFQPHDEGIAQALATVLTYHAQTRREGITRLAELNLAHPTAGTQAAWRQALLWLQADQPEDVARFSAYLSKYPKDVEILRRYHQIKAARPDLHDPQTQSQLATAFNHLHHGQGHTAASEFSMVLQRHPDDLQAMGGLGSALMQQQRFAEATGWLDRAAAGDPQWQGARRSAHYWASLQQLQELAVHQPQQAIDGLRTLLGRDPLPAAGWTALARLLLRGGHYDQAIQAANQAFSRDPGDLTARRVLIQGYVHTDQLDQAQKIFTLMDPLERDELGGWARLHSGPARREAARAWATGDASGARKVLQQALSSDPSNPWLRLDLARLDQAAGHPQAARHWLDPLRHPAGDPVQALYAWATFHAEVVDRAAAYQALKEIPAPRRTSAMRAMLRQLAIELEAAHAQRLAATGQWPQARALLSALDQAVHEGPAGDLGAVAEAYARLGFTSRALQLAHQLLVYAQGDQAIAVRLQYAWILLAADQYPALKDSLAWFDGADLDIGQHKQWSALQRTLALRLFEQARQRGELRQAQALLAPWQQQSPDSPDVLAAQAQLCESRQQYRQALQFYQRALRFQPGDVDLTLAVADAARQAGAGELAADELRQLSQRIPDDRRVVIATARLDQARGLDRQAISLYRKALQPSAGGLGVTEASTSRRVMADGQALDPQQLAEDAGIAGVALPVNVDTMPPPAPMAAAQAARRQLTAELGALEAADSSSWASGPIYRTRTGSAGTGRLSDLEVPVQGRLALDQGWLTLVVTPTWLEAGRVAGSYSARSQFGSGILGSLLDRQTWSGGGQQAHGTATALAYDRGALHLDLGTTPQAFTEARLLGGASYHGQWGDGYSYSVQASRRSVTDSLLSMAGTEDPRTGQRWGGVTANGVGFQLGHDHAGSGFYLYGSYALLTGTQVRVNTRGEVGGGQYLPLLKNDWQALSLGWNLAYMWYRNNQQGFTYGNGGYFSPQYYANLGAPLHWNGHAGRVNWQLDLTVGLQSFHQQASDYFPTSQTMQQAARIVASIAEAEGLAGVGDPVYASESRFGAAYSFDAAVEYRMARHLYLGTRLELDNASNYRQYSAGLYLRFQFDDHTGVIGETPRSLLSPYGASAWR